MFREPIGDVLSEGPIKIKRKRERVEMSIVELAKILLTLLYSPSLFLNPNWL